MSKLETKYKSRFLAWVSTAKYSTQAAVSERSTTTTSQIELALEVLASPAAQEEHRPVGGDPGGIGEGDASRRAQRSFLPGRPSLALRGSGRVASGGDTLERGQYLMVCALSPLAPHRGHV